MRTAAARIGSAFLVAFGLSGAVPAHAQEDVSEIMPLQSIRISAASLQSAFPDAPIENVQPQLIVPRTEREPRRPEALFPLYASLVTLQGLDIHSTRRAIDSGSGHEANPAMRGVVNNSAAFIAVKAGATAGVIWASEKMWKKNRKGAVIFAAIVNAAMAAVVASNYRHGRDR
jgi:hypothetical protein